MLSAQDRASAWRIRRANRSRVHVGKLTPWAAGLVIPKGGYVSSFGLAWEAQNSGVTAGTAAPVNEGGASFMDDGGVNWLHVPLLLTQPPQI